MNKKKLLYALLKELNNNNKVNAELLGLDKEQYYKILDLAYTSEFINKLPKPVRGGWQSKIEYFEGDNDLNITLKGIEYLKENSTLGKTYRGLKEIKDWIKL